MDLYLKVLEGPRAGDIFKIQKGATLGRSKADINLKDPKASAIHSVIEADMGVYTLVDQNSSNGSLVLGTRQDQIELKPGIQIVIGSTKLEVQTQFQVKAKDSSLSFWREDLYNTLQNILAPQNPRNMQPFPKIIKIRVVQGIQAGEEWFLGYGPREFGSKSWDGTLLEPQAPDTCFEVLLHNGELFIETKHKDKVLINSQKKDSEIIHDGLEVRISNTTLEFSFANTDT